MENDLGYTVELKPWQKKLNEVIFGAETVAGRAFDIALLVVILLSVIGIMLDSVPSIAAKYHDELYIFEWVVTIIFTLEYILRLICIKKPIKYIFSFYGVIDFLSIIPTFIGLFYTGTGVLRVLRSLRLLRLFKILKLSQFVHDSNNLLRALKSSKNKIIVFLMTVLMLVIILGTIMYLIEDEEAGFISIPESIYWAIVTLTTVGYGDIAPVTPLGQFIASVVMILGYAIIAVPTGIVTTELVKTSKNKTTNIACDNCGKEGHDLDAKYCNHCGHILE